MTRKTFDKIFFTIILVSIVLMLCTAVAFKTLETDRAFTWIAHYYIIPAAIISFLLSIPIYFRFLKSRERRRYKLAFWTHARSVFRIISLTVALVIIATCTAIPLIFLTNACLGSQSIQVVAEVTDFHEGRSRKGVPLYSIKFYEAHLKREVVLSVNHRYNIGDTFSANMYVGKWGLLYK